MFLAWDDAADYLLPSSPNHRPLCNIYDDMEIICDTNIWYNIGNGNIDHNDLKSENKYIVTFNSIDEIAFTTNLLQHTEYTRNAIRSMFKYSRNHAIYEPPLIYLKKLDTEKFNYDIFSNHKNILEFTELIAKGHNIDISKQEECEKIIRNRKKNLKEISDFFNNNALKIRKNIKNKKKHRLENSIPINRLFISEIVKEFTGTNGLSDNFDWNQISLFENALKVFLNQLETGATNFVENDLYDLFLLVYVNPNRKFWTKEKKWKNIIVEAGMKGYLYET